MAEKRSRTRRPKRQDYVPHDNAVHITLYNPSGEALPEGIADIATDRLLDLAMDNRLLIGVATT